MKKLIALVVLALNRLYERGISLPFGVRNQHLPYGPCGGPNSGMAAEIEP